jgi:hypothetical protein
LWANKKGKSRGKTPRTKTAPAAAEDLSKLHGLCFADAALAAENLRDPALGEIAPQIARRPSTLVQGIDKETLLGGGGPEAVSFPITAVKWRFR